MTEEASGPVALGGASPVSKKNSRERSGKETYDSKCSTYINPVVLRSISTFE